MIITCNKCSTSFSLDDLLVKEEGSKVRCSVCKNIFTVFPGPGEAKQEPQALSGLTLESDGDDAFDASDDFGIHDNDLVLEEPSIIDEDAGDDDADDFSFEDDEFKFDDHKEPQGPEPDDESLEFEDDDIEFETEPDEDSDGIEFELMDDEPGSIDFEGDEPGLEMETQTPDMDSRTEDQSMEDVAFEDESSTEEGEFELEFDVEDDAEIEGFEDEPEEPALEMEMETEAEEAGLSLDYAGLKDEEGKDDEHTLMAPEDDFSGYDAVLEQKTEPEDEILVEEETIGVEDIPEREEIAVVEPQRPASTEPARAGRRKKKPLVGAPVLVLMLIALLVVGAYIASVMTGYNIPYLSDLKIPIVEQYLRKAPAETPEAKPVPNQKSVNGRFVTNSTAGTLFVITGRVENPSNIAYSHIKVQGALITKGKVESKTKDAFCGNIITEEMLKTGNISDINKQIMVKEGNHNSNLNVKPGAGVPFMVVFSDLPEKLQNFTVKVVGSEPAKGN